MVESAHDACGLVGAMEAERHQIDGFSRRGALREKIDKGLIGIDGFVRIIGLVKGHPLQEQRVTGQRVLRIFVKKFVSQFEHFVVICLEPYWPK